MNKKNLEDLKNAKIELENLLFLIQNEKNKLEKQKINKNVYSDGFDLLIDTNKLDEIINNKNKIQNAKLTEAFKDIYKIIEKEFFSIILKNKNKMIKDFNNLNPSKNLLPMKENIFAFFDEFFQSFFEEVNNFITEETSIVFSQGRQNQTLYKNKNDLSKYLKKDKTLKLFLINLSETLNNKIKIFINKDYLYDILQKDLNKEEIVDFINIYFNNLQKNENSFIQSICLNIYTQGNLYQLVQDNIKNVKFMTSCNISNCLYCREIQRCEANLYYGNILLNRENGYYNLSEIISYLNFSGMEIFTHPGCTCQFIE